jgi:hypothetical protein
MSGAQGKSVLLALPFLLTVVVFLLTLAARYEAHFSDS